MVNYPIRILKNETDKPIEFMCGGKIIIFKAGEQRPLDGFEAYHALNQVNTGLTEVVEPEEPEEPEEPAEPEAGEVQSSTKPAPVPLTAAYLRTLSWGEIQALAKNKPWNRGTPNKKQIIKELINESKANV